MLSSWTSWPRTGRSQKTTRKWPHRSMQSHLLSIFPPSTWFPHWVEFIPTTGSRPVPSFQFTVSFGIHNLLLQFVGSLTWASLLRERSRFLVSSKGQDPELTTSNLTRGGGGVTAQKRLRTGSLSIPSTVTTQPHATLVLQCLDSTHYDAVWFCFFQFRAELPRAGTHVSVTSWAVQLVCPVFREVGPRFSKIFSYCYYPFR